MQIPSTESSWTDVTIPNNTSVLSLVVTCQSKNKIKVQGSDNVQNEKVQSGSINWLVIWTIISYCTFRIANNFYI